jgi:predicted PurR-regulated permease PerM
VNRKIAVIIIISAIFLAGLLDMVVLISSSGVLNRLVDSISKFGTLYSQSTQMENQLTNYSSLLNAKKISISELKNKLLQIMPNASFKIAGDTLSLQSQISVNPYVLINLLSQFTNVDVIGLQFQSDSPIFYEYRNYDQKMGPKYSLKIFTVKVYGG